MFRRGREFRERRALARLSRRAVLRTREPEPIDLPPSLKVPHRRDINPGSDVSAYHDSIYRNLRPGADELVRRHGIDVIAPGRNEIGT